MPAIELRDFIELSLCMLATPRERSVRCQWVDCRSVNAHAEQTHP